MLRIRLTRRGKKKQPIYRIVVAEHTRPVKGKFVEILGFYNPMTKDMAINKEKTEKWLKDGAKPSTTVAMLLRKQGFELSEEFQKAKKYVKAKKEKKKEEIKSIPTKDSESKEPTEQSKERPKAEQPKEESALPPDSSQDEVKGEEGDKKEVENPKPEEKETQNVSKEENTKEEKTKDKKEK